MGKKVIGTIKVFGKKVVTKKEYKNHILVETWEQNDSNDWKELLIHNKIKYSLSSRVEKPHKSS